jgi:hypothetical protein
MFNIFGIKNEIYQSTHFKIIDNIRIWKFKTK